MLEYDYSKEAIGKRLLLVRMATGKSTTEFSKTLNIIPQRWGNYETGKRLPSPEILMLIWKHFQVPTDYVLLGRTDALTMATAKSLQAAETIYENKQSNVER